MSWAVRRPHRLVSSWEAVARGGGDCGRARGTRWPGHGEPRTARALRALVAGDRTAESGQSEGGNGGEEWKRPVGNTLTCCFCPKASPKRGQRSRTPSPRSMRWRPGTVAVAPSHAALEPVKLDFGAGEDNTCSNTWDREMPEDVALESTPSDHPRTGTVFLSESQTDGKKIIFSSEKKIENCFCFVHYKK
uniref:Uncharacterized protein n=1 Tax=Rhinolophus ferrumequinum TaxID=59479 RepID=A0A671DS60_RHIFE